MWQIGKLKLWVELTFLWVFQTAISTNFEVQVISNFTVVHLENWSFSKCFCYPHNTKGNAQFSNVIQDKILKKRIECNLLYIKKTIKVQSI